MPSVSIETRLLRSVEEDQAIIKAVHSALLECFRILPNDRNIRLNCHDPERFSCPPDLARPECFTQIIIECFPGRTLQAKRALYKTLVTNLEPLGIPADHVSITLREIEQENWGIWGGQAACDIDFDYKIDV